jgi:DNA-binding NtrC family response regulator
MSQTAGSSRAAGGQGAARGPGQGAPSGPPAGRTPYSVLSLRFDRISTKGAEAKAEDSKTDPVAQLEGLERSDIRVASCDTIEQARHVVERYRPIAGLLHFGAHLDGAVIETTLALAQAAPRLRLIALIEPPLAHAAELAKLVSKGLLHDFHTLPVSRDRLMFSLGHIAGLVALEESGQRGDVGAGEHPEHQIVGASPRMLQALQAIRKFAEIDAPVLVTGEAGTGKELAARALHNHSPRAAAAFATMSCAGLPTSILEAELFGYERGAFTGAIKQKVGRIEAARGGTLFLDEIGELPLEVQGQLLQFLQERKIKRLGGTRAIGVDTRIVAATKINLEEAVKTGRFREDLYYQLNVLTVDVPPLCERGDDVQLLATYFLRKFSTELKLPKLGFHDGAIEKLQRYRWPGNVRELISTVRRAVVMAEGRWLMAADLTFTESPEGENIALPELAAARKQLEEKLLRDALRINGGNIKRAAKELGVSRVTFYRLMEKYRIHPEGAHTARPAMPRPMPPRHPVPRPSFRRAGVAGRSGGKAEDDGRSGDLT